MIGGTTYEEARAVALLNQQLVAAAAAGPGGSSSAPRILLGGTCVHNSSRFVSLLFIFCLTPLFALLLFALTRSSLSPFSISSFLLSSFLDMVEDSATRFPPSFYTPPSTLSSVAAPINLSLPSFIPSSSSPNPNLSTSPPPPLSNSAINLRLGNYEVGTGGLYRTTNTNGSAATLSIDSNKVKEGLSNGLAGASAGAMSLLERVRQGVEARRQSQALAASQQQQ